MSTKKFEWQSVGIYVSRASCKLKKPGGIICEYAITCIYCELGRGEMDDPKNESKFSDSLKAILPCP